MKHTPGQWKRAYGGLDNGKEPKTREEFLEWCGEIWDNTEPRGEHINCVYGDNDTCVVAITGNGPRGEANARLITAALDLLEACQEVIAKLRGQHLGTEIGLDTIEKIQKAIAKTEETL